MNLFRRLREMFTSGQAVEVASTSTRHGRYGIRAYTPASEIDFAKYIGRFRDNAIVAALHAHIARSVSEARIYVHNTDGEEIDGHPFNDLWARPNEDQSSNDLMSAWLLDLMTGGNAYGNVVPNRLGQPAEIQYLPMMRTSPISLDPAFVRLITHYEYRTPTGKVQRIDKTQIAHSRMGIDPDDQAKGISPLSSMVREIATDNLGSRYTAAMLLNYGAATVFMTPEGEAFNLDPESWEAAVEELTLQMTGDSIGSMVAPNFPARIESIGVKPSDMALGDMGAVATARICAAFGADPMVLGLSSANKTYSNLREAQDATWHNCSRPLLGMVVSALQRSVLHGAFGDTDLRLGVDTSGVTALMDDQLERVKTWSTAYQLGTVTRGEAKREMGLDATDADEVYYHEAIMGEPSQTDVAAVRKAATLANGRRAALETGALEPDPEE